jgi:hypothetical protein
MRSVCLRKPVAQGRAREIVEVVATFFEERLWESKAGVRIRSRLERAGVDEPTMRAFRTGYAPGEVSELLRHLSALGYEDEELVAAGVATRSGREHFHVLFHARVMFPIREPEGRVRGFAGLATHLGPSWPLWVTSPEGEVFRQSSAMFGIDLALPAIADAGRALIKRDCVEVMRLHQDGRAEAVGVIQSPVTREHLALLARTLGVASRELSVIRNPGLDAVLVQPPGGEVGPEAFGPSERPYGSAPIAAAIRSDREFQPETSDVFVEAQPEGARAFVYVGGILIGAGIPLGTLILIAPDTGGPSGATPALNVVIAVVGASYLALTIVVSRISAKRRARSHERRMRLPWARGSGEVQPRGWTYHHVEEVLIGAALVSALVCVVLWMTIGGFLG